MKITLAAVALAGLLIIVHQTAPAGQIHEAAKRGDILLPFKGKL